MADIFGKLNDFNLRLQGKYKTVFSVKDNATAITRKLKFWCKNVKIDDFACFPLLQNFLGDNNLTIDQSVKSDIVRHLQELQNIFLLYFPKGMFNCDWVRNPFSCSTAPFTGKTMEEFIELSSDGNLKLQFTSHLSSKFWLSVQKEYPTLAREALKKLLPFATTYLRVFSLVCAVTGFSRYVSTKTKYRNRLDAEADMYIQLSTIKPDDKHLSASMQAHPSH